MLCLGRVILGTLVLTSASPRSARLAAPEVIVLNGGPLQHRVVLAGFAENLRLMLATRRVAQVTSDSLRNRPRIRVAMYWGVQWRGRADLPDTVALSLTPDGAQSGAFYPAWRGRAPLWEFGAAGAMPRSIRLISQEGLAILRKNGIPTAA